MKTNERAKNPMDTERREQEPGRKDKMDPRQPMPRQPEQGQPERRQPGQPEQGQPEHRQLQPRHQEPREPHARQPEPPDRRTEAPRERSDEDTIGRPVQLDDDPPMGDLDEPDPATKGEPQRERRGAR